MLGYMSRAAVAKDVFRAMRAAADGWPVVGRSARELGVRTVGSITDLPVAVDGWVEPGTGCLEENS